jgi:hypothetical protein
MERVLISSLDNLGGRIIQLNVGSIPLLILFFVIDMMDDAPQNSLKNSNVSLKVKIVGKKGVRVRSLTRNTSGVKRASWSYGMGIRMSDKWVNYSYGPTQIE